MNNRCALVQILCKVELVGQNWASLGPSQKIHQDPSPKDPSRYIVLTLVTMTAGHHRRARRASIHSLSLHAPRRNPAGGGLANPPISKVETPITNSTLPPTPPERTRTHGEYERRQPTKSRLSDGGSVALIQHSIVLRRVDSQ